MSELGAGMSSARAAFTRSFIGNVGDEGLSLMFGKFIFECAEENLILAGRTAKRLMDDQTNSECMLYFGDNEKTQIVMYARRLKRSISVKQIKP